MRRHDVQHALPIVRTAAGLDHLAEHGLLAAIVAARVEDEAGTLARLHRPARERPGHVDDVGLGVAAVDAERVELEQLSRVILVDARRTPGLRSLCTRCTLCTSCTLRTLRTLGTREPVVEIEQHGGMLRRGA